MNLLNLRYGLVDELRDSHLIKKADSVYHQKSGNTIYAITPQNYDEETLDEIDCLFSELLCTYDLNLKNTDYIIK